MQNKEKAPIDPRIFTQGGELCSLQDLHVRPFSRMASTIAHELHPLHLSDPHDQRRLLENFSRYGFSVLEPSQEVAVTVTKAFEALKNFLHHAPIEDKLAFRQGGAPGMDVKYNPPKIKGAERSPFEEIVTQRDFVLNKEFAERWPASAQDLRVAAQNVMLQFEGVAQQVLTIIERLYHAPEGLFSEIAFNSDLSTLRMIHCMPESMLNDAPAVYGTPVAPSEPEHRNMVRSCITVHTDWGPLTILPVATTGGLEYWYEDVEHPEGAGSGWVALSAKRGHLLAMLGNVSDIFSRGTLRAVPHRVRVVEEQERFSFAYFVEVKSQVDLDRIKRSLVIPDVPEERESYYEQEARMNVDGTLTAQAYLNFMLQK